MSSREFDDPLDNLLQQALQPFAEATPPGWVWPRVLRRVGRTSYSWRARVRSWLRFLDVSYAPSFSDQLRYVRPYYESLPASVSGMAMGQFFNWRVAF